MNPKRYLLILPILALSFFSPAISFGQEDETEKKKLPPPTREEPKKEMHTWLGVATAPVNPSLRQHLGLDDGFGVMLSHVQEESPAQKAGLKAGDVLSLLDDQLLTSPEHLAILVRSKKKGDEIDLTYIRKGDEEKTKVVLGEIDHSTLPGPKPMLPYHKSPQDWQKYHQDIRRHQEQFRNKMEEFHRNRGRMDREAPKRDMHQPFRQGGKPDRDRPRDYMPMKRKGPPANPFAKSEATVKIDNDQGEVTISKKDGKGNIEISDADGNEIYKGPFDPAKGFPSLPENAREHLKKMKVDQIDILSPTPKPMPPRPEVDKPKPQDGEVN